MMGDPQLNNTDAVAEMLRLDAEIAGANATTKRLKAERQAIIDQEAQQLAKLQIGQEVETTYGYGNRPKTRRYRITEIRGRGYSSFMLQGKSLRPAYIEPTYFGAVVRKDKTLGEVKPIYNVVVIHPVVEGDPVIRGEWLESNHGTVIQSRESPQP